MFGNKWFFWKIFFLCILISVALVESSRQKKDVHHMIILKDDYRPSKNRHSKPKSKKHSKRHRHHSSEEVSFEEEEEEERPRPKRGKKYKKHHHDVVQSAEKWTPITSKEFFKNHNYFSQPVPLEITTPPFRQPYKPFDYSILEMKPPQQDLASSSSNTNFLQKPQSTPLSIVVEEVKENKAPKVRGRRPFGSKRKVKS